MISKSVVVALLAAGCMTAAAGGAYVAVRHNDSAEPVRQDDSGRVAAPSQPASQPAKPVSETEAEITPVKAEQPERAVAPATPSPRQIAPERSVARKVDSTPRVESNRAPARASSGTPPAAPRRETAPRASEAPADPPMNVERPATRDAVTTAPATPPPAPLPEPVIPEPAPAKPQFVEVVVPMSSVVGLRVDTAVSSETARVEDRIEARVTRDVMADGRVAIPAGTRALGDVVMVERGGKLKDKARLGVRFHTLVLANGNQVPFRTDAIYREGASPGTESARKIGGAAVGGAILGAIIGGAKGAAIGGATGAAGGSAVVMAGDRNTATLPAGTVITVRLNSPVSVDIEREN
jgi:hypothetical protein